MPRYCPRCSTVFDNTDEELAHVRDLNRCPIVPNQPFLGLTPEQLSKMVRATRKMTLEERWRRDYSIIFSKEPTSLKNPYRSPIHDDIDIVTEVIKSTPNVSRGVLDQICQYIESQRLIPRPPSHPPPRAEVGSSKDPQDLSRSMDTVNSVKLNFDIPLGWPQHSVEPKVDSQVISGDIQTESSEGMTFLTSRST
jgi:hypothetical protein